MKPLDPSTSPFKPANLPMIAGQPIRTMVIQPAPRMAQQVSLEQLTNTPSLAVELCSDLSGFLNRLNQNEEPELVLVFQDWSDQYSARQIEQLVARLPLARILCIYGPLCSADGRTRSLWPLSLRIPVWKFWQRLEQEIHVLRHSTPALPSTATREELLRFESSPGTLTPEDFPEDSLSVSENSPRPQPVCILTPDVAWGEMLVELIAAQQQRPAQVFGLPLSGSRKLPPGAQVILDIDPLCTNHHAHLARLIRKNCLSVVACISNFSTFTPQIPAELRQNAPLLDRLNLPELLNRIQSLPPLPLAPPATQMT